MRRTSILAVALLSGCTSSWLQAQTTPGPSFPSCTLDTSHVGVYDSPTATCKATMAEVEALHDDKFLLLDCSNDPLTGNLHIQPSSSGATPFAGFDELVVESSGNTGIQIQTPNASTSELIFGSASDSLGAQVAWKLNDDLMTIGTANTGADVKIQVDNASDLMWLDSAGKVGIGTNSPDQKLHVMESSAGSVTGTEAVVVEASNEAFIQTLTADGTALVETYGGLIMGEVSDTNAAEVTWNSFANTLVVGTRHTGGEVAINTDTSNPTKGIHIYSDGSFRAGGTCQASAPFTCNSGNANRQYCDSTTSNKPCWCDGSSFVDLTGGAGDCT